MRYCLSQEIEVQKNQREAGYVLFKDTFPAGSRVIPEKYQGAAGRAYAHGSDIANLTLPEPKCNLLYSRSTTLSVLPYTHSKFLSSVSIWLPVHIASKYALFCPFWKP